MIPSAARSVSRITERGSCIGRVQDNKLHNEVLSIKAPSLNQKEDYRKDVQTSLNWVHCEIRFQGTILYKGIYLGTRQCLIKTNGINKVYEEHDLHSLNHK